MDRLFEYIKVKRSMRNISQKELARRAGIGVNTLMKIEKGEANPTLSVLQKIYEVLDLELLVKDKNLSRPRLASELSISCFVPDIKEEEENRIRKTFHVFETYSKFADMNGHVKIPMMTFVWVLTGQENINEEELDIACSVLERAVTAINMLNDRGQIVMRIEDMSFPSTKDYVSLRYVMKNNHITSGQIFSYSMPLDTAKVKTNRNAYALIQNMSPVDYVLFEDIMGIKDKDEKARRLDTFLQRQGWTEEQRRIFIGTDKEAGQEKDT